LYWSYRNLLCTVVGLMSTLILAKGTMSEPRRSSRIANATLAATELVGTESSPVVAQVPSPPKTARARASSTKRKGGEVESSSLLVQKRPKTRNSTGVTTQGQKSTLTLEDLINNPIVQGNRALIDEIKRASKSEDDPPLIFFWDTARLTEFLHKMTATANAPPPPAEFAVAAQAGLGPGNVGNDSSEKLLARGILDFVENLVPRGVQRFHHNRRGGLACKGAGFGRACAEASRLEFDPWFSAVLAAGIPLGGPLARVCIPTPNSQDGHLEGDCVSGPLWV
jgi:hypothetical protein